METTKKPSERRYWVIAVIIIVFLLTWVIRSQEPTIISSTISPEVIVKGQSQEVKVTVIVKPNLFIPPILKAVMSEQGNKSNPNSTQGWVKYFSEFRLNPKTLGYLKKTGKDENGYLIYSGTYTVNIPQAQTVQIQPTNILGKNLLPGIQIIHTSIFSDSYALGSLPQMSRLAVTRQAITLPPDPGEDGKTTLEGIDSDKDGLRDDVQREIMFLAPESEKLRMAMTLSAKAIQKQSVSENLTKAEKFAVQADVSDGYSCINYFMFENKKIPSDSEIQKGYFRSISIRDMIENTSTRKYLAVEVNLKPLGMLFGGQDELSRCHFNPSDYQD